jgi:hypothetical protein
MAGVFAGIEGNYNLQALGQELKLVMQQGIPSNRYWGAVLLDNELIVRHPTSNDRQALRIAKHATYLLTHRGQLVLSQAIFEQTWLGQVSAE